MELNTVIVLGTCAVVAYAIRQARKCYEACTDFDEGFQIGYEDGQIALRDDMQSVKEALGRSEKVNDYLASVIVGRTGVPAGWDKV